MSTQLIGFSIGGITKRFLVSPPSMIWPTNLVNCALFNTLHSQEYAGMGTRGGISRERFFIYGFIGSFAWCRSNILTTTCAGISSYEHLDRFLPGVYL